MSKLPTTFDYDGRRFTRSDVADAPIATYSQLDNLLSGVFAGGSILGGVLTGIIMEDSIIHFGYSMVDSAGQVIIGRCSSYPTIDENGLISLEEHWERFAPVASQGISYLRELGA